MGQATGPQLLGSIVKSNGYGPAFVTAGVGLFIVAAVSVDHVPKSIFLRTLI